MNIIQGTIITDCADDNARARQQARFSELFCATPTFLGLGASAPDIEAGGNLIDQLDAVLQSPTSVRKEKRVILLNVAPRGERVRKKWDNGTPFCYVWVENVLIVSTFAGRSLAFLKKFDLAKSVRVLDIPTVVDQMVACGELNKEVAQRITNTQFRSFEFLPLAAYWVLQGRELPFTTYDIESSSEINGVVWTVDSFGNAKTTITKDEIAFQAGKEVYLKDGAAITCYERLADVPRHRSALVCGSSGLGNTRFLEVVVQWKDDGFKGSANAAERHGLFVGAKVFTGSEAAVKHAARHV